MEILQKIRNIYKGEINVFNFVDIFIHFDSEAKYRSIKTDFLLFMNESECNIKIFDCCKQGDIFEESVRIISSIEDNLKVDIPYISIDYNFTSDRINIVEFYGDSKNFILNCNDSSEIISAISWIERHNYNNVFIGLMQNTFKWIHDRDLFYSIKSYIWSIYHNHLDIDNTIYPIVPLLEKYGYKGYLINER